MMLCMGRILRIQSNVYIVLPSVYLCCSDAADDAPVPSGVPPPPKPPRTEQSDVRPSEQDSVLDDGRDSSMPHQGTDIVSEQYNF